jgi:hypothetical protein
MTTANKEFLAKESDQERIKNLINTINGVSIPYRPHLEIQGRRKSNQYFEELIYIKINVKI